MSTPSSSDFLGTPSDWLSLAASDLAAAQDLCLNPRVLPTQAAFHAQQAVEKAIKGVLLQHGIEFPPTHNLNTLIVAWQRAGHLWPPALRDAGSLTLFAVQSRYPGVIQQISRAEVGDAIKIAEKVVSWAEAFLRPPPASARKGRRAARMTRPIARR